MESAAAAEEAQSGDGTCPRVKQRRETAKERERECERERERERGKGGGAAGDT